ncbi:MULTISPECIES: hypothetical protein [Pseudomonas]|uniref:hypothetical protein n=1 Tax=Pseudomonas TaxID=286 RepID=UPI0006B63430|nr:hypothetical protein [Pseudomonas fuscovaginae]KPA99428.1 hypothetical protein PF70_00404 [Pseudomonas fuscovaginae]
MPFTRPPEALARQIEQLEEAVVRMREQASVLAGERLFVAAEQLLENASRLEHATANLKSTAGR